MTSSNELRQHSLLRCQRTTAACPPQHTCCWVQCFQLFGLDLPGKNQTVHFPQEKTNLLNKLCETSTSGPRGFGWPFYCDCLLSQPSCPLRSAAHHGQCDWHNPAIPCCCARPLGKCNPCRGKAAWRWASWNLAIDLDLLLQLVDATCSTLKHVMHPLFTDMDCWNLQSCRYVLCVAMLRFIAAQCRTRRLSTACSDSLARRAG